MSLARVCSFALVLLQAAPASYQERDFLTRTRRLTVEGKRAGEGYWSPDGKRLVFQSERERRYAWDYDEHMDIWSYNEKPGAMKQLTTARGYDAEGSYSPDGQWIVFSSMRSAYDHPLDEKEKKALGENPSNFAEIYIMKAD